MSDDSSKQAPTVTRSVAGLRQRVADARRAGARIALVPTMGALHDGHLALLRAARAESDLLVASLFVNPAQFDRADDLARYPRSEDADRELLAAAGCDVLFAPAADEMYPPGFATSVHVGGLSERYEGAVRGAAHFHGVATVVTKLLCQCLPDAAYFGEKDAQQLRLIRRLVADLNLPVEIVAVPTVRDADGLALSSRNALLTPAERARARALPAALAAARAALDAGERDGAAIAARAEEAIRARGAAVEYVAVVDPGTFEPLETVGETALVAVAARVGDVRLIDNELLPRPEGSGESNESDAGEVATAA